MSEYVFRNVSQIGEKEYQTVIDGQELAEMWRDGIITYNPEIQRGTKVKRGKDNSEVEVAVYSKANVKKIYESMLSGQYFTDMITLNILADGSEKIELDDEGNLNVNGEINISDGQHRIRALAMILESNDKENTAFDLTELKFPVKITNYDVQTAQQQFHQFSQGLKISSSRSEYFNQTGLANIIVKELMKNSDLAGRVEVVRNSIPKNDERHIVTFATLVNAIEIVYKDLETRVQAMELSKYLTEFFNELINLIPELYNYEKRVQSKETSLIGENFMFYGYVAISKVIREKENWKEYLPLVNELDLSKGSKQWYGDVIKRGKERGYSIINTSESREKFKSKIERMFKKLLNEKTE
ncbi:DNA-sulfur modification-associated [Caloramator quimbayensis]|uniref:DNA-sulfur modification-associated n=1 Tax=Caloramator quimbayensis TaxID=1147123 RepID=A0A1T4XD79_9CLOT|nr:DNA sulfur modification protein DndB [Caloramator quimbayensis]SKA87530.1 DNA-sulfur modification-associated [Caloramator quimbayensis]